MAQALDSLVLVEVDDDLDIGRGVEGMARGLELRSELRTVVDLSIADDHDGSVLVGNGLIPGLEIDDAEAPYSQADTRRPIEPAAVRPAMAQDRRHPLEQGPVDRPTRISQRYATNATHSVSARPVIFGRLQ